MQFRINDLHDNIQSLCDCIRGIKNQDDLRQALEFANSIEHANAEEPIIVAPYSGHLESYTGNFLKPLNRNDDCDARNGTSPPTAGSNMVDTKQKSSFPYSTESRSSADRPQHGNAIRAHKQGVTAFETAQPRCISVALDFESLLPPDDPPRANDETPTFQTPAYSEQFSNEGCPKARTLTANMRASSVESTTSESLDTKLSDDPLVDSTPSRKQKKQFRKRQVSRVLRALHRAEEQVKTDTTTKACAQKYVSQASIVGLPTCNTSEFARLSTSWRGSKPEDKNSGPSSVPSHFRLLQWDEAGNGTSLLVDSQGRVFGVITGGPGKSSRNGSSAADWQSAIKGCERAICRARQSYSFNKSDLDHKRGTFPALAIGITRGPGSADATLRHATTSANAQVLDDLLKNENMRRIAGYQSSLLHLHAPILGTYFRSNLNAVINHNPNLHRNFPSSDFASITVNFGPRTVCKKHKDSMNLSWGWCAITALGEYNYRRGGHLILWDLGLVIEFPPGATILIPSAALHHSNTPIAEDETRYSVTQYTAAEIFHWVHDGFRMAKEVPPPTEEEKQTIWKDGIAMYRTV
ncbi:hypothetical protein ONZ45_g10076 [Pleurotus djamor]|nr:hypothetical protein ONZ45_g10076 [Pleurotus djamor]